MAQRPSRFLRNCALALGGLLLLALLAGGWFYHRLDRSRPQLDGTAHVNGLGTAVTVERDALGVPTVRGANRVDVARALGWLHAQERFFQMDLMRRRAAGELAELVGAKALPLDRETRVYEFRRFAQSAVARLPAEQFALVEAYTAGVNAGLAALGAPPWEYLMLRVPPRGWSSVDCALVAYAMTLDLQDAGAYERSLTTLRNVLGESALRFFAPLVGPDDAALDGSTAPLAPIPSAEVLNLRKPAAAKTTASHSEPPADDPAVIGSNSFALAGAHTATGAGLLANDMHLNLGVPNTWYRAALVWGTPPHQVTGVTLPGLPLVIAGSNGHIAWGFTNSYADVADLVVVEPNTIDRTLYKRGERLAEFAVHTQTIAVKGGEPVQLETQWSEWGPVVAMGEKNRPLALAWTALDADAIDLRLSELETATTTAAALAIAQRSGMPAQNFLVADRAGAIGWTIAGRLPQRVGFDGRFPVPRTYLDRRWEGFLPPDKYPCRIDLAAGRLATANQRLLGGDELDLLGDGGYDDAYRGRQIRDGLATLERATPRDLLAIALDDRALFLQRWRDLALRVLTPDVVAQKKSRAEFRRALEKWEGRASVESVSYRLARAFRTSVVQLALGPIFAGCEERDERFNWRKFHYEPALWALLEAKPLHLLAPAYAQWDDLLVAAIDDATAQIEKQNGSLASATWGRRNTARLRHPLARSLPAWATGWLSMPPDPIPGDSRMPRVGGPDFGASERFVVSPGREAEGIFHMPGGQSAHPLSPFFRAGHADWVRGNPTPFLPGPTQYRLELKP